SARRLGNSSKPSDARCAMQDNARSGGWPASRMPHIGHESNTVPRTVPLPKENPTIPVATSPVLHGSCDGPANAVFLQDTPVVCLAKGACGVSEPDSRLETPAPAGRVEIAETAIAHTIQEAVLSCYGVVDLGPRSIGSAISRRLRITTSPPGIDIAYTESGDLQIEVSIVVEYGTPIFTVAQNVMQTVKFQVEHLLGMTVDRVNVNVDGLRVSARTEKAP